MNLISKSNKSIYNILFKKEEERSISPEIVPDEEDKIKDNNIEPLIKNLVPKNENKK